MRYPDKMQLHHIRVAFDVARTHRRDAESGKEYSTRDFAAEYLQQDFSMLSKVLSGKAKSEPILEAVLLFIRDTQASPLDTLRDFGI